MLGDEGGVADLFFLQEQQLRKQKFKTWNALVRGCFLELLISRRLWGAGKQCGKLLLCMGS